MTWDCRAWFELADGSWLQETQPYQGPKAKTPDFWQVQKRRWQRRLEQLAVTDFQLNLAQTRAFLFEPRTQALPEQRDWTFSWTLPSRGLGPLLGSMSFRQSTPPSDFVAQYLAALSRVPVLKPGASAPQDLFFDGRLLLHFLGGSIQHLERHTSETGCWRHQPPKRDVPTSPVEPFSGTTESLAQPRHSPLLPRELAFFPHETATSLPESGWQALHYDSDTRRLVCQRFHEGALQWAAWHLPKPLYRLFSHCRFLAQRQTLVVQKRRISMPDAVLPQHALSV